MAQVVFKKGALEQLQSTPIVEGQILITTDERAIYVDVDADSRIRLGDFREVENIAGLPSEADETALYYAAAENVLCKWDGEQWVHINENTDTGATAIEVTGGGDTHSGISATYQTDGRKIVITLAKELVDATKVNELIEAAIQEDETDLTTLKKNVQTLMGDEATEGSVKKTVADAKKAVIGTEDDESSAETLHGVKAYADEQIKAQLGSVYKAAGSKASVEELPDLGEGEVGNVYNMTAQFTTTADFVEDAGKSYPAGTNVVCVTVEGTQKWDVLAGFVDLTGYATETYVGAQISTAKTELTGTSTTITNSTIKGAAEEAYTKASGELTKALEWGAFGAGE